MNNEVYKKRGKTISITSPSAFFKSNQFTRLRLNIDQFFAYDDKFNQNYIIL